MKSLITGTTGLGYKGKVKLSRKTGRESEESRCRNQGKRQYLESKPEDFGQSKPICNYIVYAW